MLFIFATYLFNVDVATCNLKPIGETEHVKDDDCGVTSLEMLKHVQVN